MRIGGIVPLSLVDYPGRPALSIFTSGCNLRCPFCHNSELVDGIEETNPERVLALLKKRAGKLVAVCISGGEPTVQDDLEVFIGRIKSLGYSVKLDTNGSRPQVLRRLLEEDLLDYVALDIKSSPQGYRAATGGRLAFETVAEAVAIVKSSGVSYELRTTAVPGLVNLEDLAIIAQSLKPIERYVLQQFRPAKTLDPSVGKVEPYTEEWFREAKKIFQGKAGEILVRWLIFKDG